MQQTMKAFVCTRYGPPEVLRLQELATPIPRDHEILIRVVATSVTSADWRLRSGCFPRGFGLLARLVLGLSKPRQAVLGSELAGVVEAIGQHVRKFQVGDAVFAFADLEMGCHATYKCMSEDAMVAGKPENLSFEEAAGLSFGGTTALYMLRKAGVKRGDKVLIVGASGGVGTAALQLCRYLGAEVTGVCSGRHAGLVRSLGASHVIDYTKQDFSCSGKTYDVIIDTTGTAPFSRSQQSLASGGRLVLVLGKLSDLLHIPWVRLTTNKRVIGGPASACKEDLQLLAQLASEGTFRPVVDRIYPFFHMVEAHRYVATGRKAGNVILGLEQGQSGPC